MAAQYLGWMRITYFSFKPPKKTNNDRRIQWKTEVSPFKVGVSGWNCMSHRGLRLQLPCSKGRQSEHTKNRRSQLAAFAMGEDKLLLYAEMKTATVTVVILLLLDSRRELMSACSDTANLRDRCKRITFKESWILFTLKKINCA